MSKIKAKICEILSLIYGYGIMISLFAGGLTFLGYLFALIIGGDTATQICTVIYKQIFPIIIIVASCIVVLGVIKMYLSGEVALCIEKQKKESEDRKHQKEKRLEK